MADLYGRPIHGKPLTEREKEVAALLPLGTNKEIAEQLGISPRTIEVHRAHILEKTGARNAADVGRMLVEAKTKVLLADLRRSLGLSAKARETFDAICKRHGVTV